MILDRLIEPVIGLPRAVKKAIALSVDASLCVLTVWLAFFLRLGEWIPLSGSGWPAAVASIIIALPVFTIFGLYRAVFRFIGSEALSAIAQAVAVYGLIFAAVFTAFAIPGIPRTVGVIQPVLLFIFVGASRAFARYWLRGGHRRARRAAKTNVLIYGAGSAGRQLSVALSETSDTKVVGFIDDARDLHGSVIGRTRVWPPDKIEALIEELEIDEILLAIPSASRSRRNEILKLLRFAGVAVRTLPGLLDLAQGKVTVNLLRPLEIEDLLGRQPVAPDTNLLEKNIRGKVVLVTGAGGSIGGELCRQILLLNPVQLLAIESSEFSLYAVHKELIRLRGDAHQGGAEVVPLLASVCDPARMRSIFAAWRPQTIYHAAAYKHVPLVEQNPLEGVKNNVTGTLICAHLAQEFRADSFVLISTDKAVRPTNVMGASKRLAEMILQALAAERPDTCFSMVRFGNVLGSSGSVVPLFRQQINSGGPVTVTHPEITRYFMTVQEAANLVIQAGAMAAGGEVFVLDMGQPVKVVDLATRMIELTGQQLRSEDRPDGDIEIVFTGLRPGEKLFEELLIGDNAVSTPHPRVMMAIENHLSLAELSKRLENLRGAIEIQDVAYVRQLLAILVPEYVPAQEIADWVYAKERTGRESLRRGLKSLFAPPASS